MRAEEIHLNRVKLLLGSTETIKTTLVAFRAVIMAAGSDEGLHEIIYTIRSLVSRDSSQFLLMERLHDYVGDGLAHPEPEATDMTPQRAWVCNSYNDASYIMGVEWLISSQGNSD